MKFVKIDVNNAIEHTSNDGGYISATCLVCGNHGWLIGKYGLKFKALNSMKNQLIHNENCKMNKIALKEFKR